ncbi:sulfite exporter TauE/SafE family protein [Candidatus Uhrbacteria bacterium]|nr:sulfite exporter TauE/SafE family protein [Candidatus Uhrbacteria bacterium]
MSTPITCENCIKPRTSLKRRLFIAGCAIGAVFLVWQFVLNPLLAFVPTATVAPSFAAMFLLGIVASVSTCLASTGAFLLAYGGASSNSHIFFVQTGRLAAFAAGGALLGMVGGAFAATGWLYGIIGLFLGVVFVLTGLHLLDLLPSNAIRLPKGFRAFADGIAEKQGRRIPFLVGAITFVLPCGFTQVAQAFALSSGSALSGAMYLTAFALGTLPVLLGVSFFGAVLAQRLRPMQLAAGAMLFLFSIGQIDGGLTVLGSPLTIGGTVSTLSGLVMPAPAKAQEQIISMRVAYGVFTPSRFVIKRGVPVRWEIDGVDIAGCANTIVAPTIGVNQSLVIGKNLVQFTPAKTGTIPFSCSMGMIRGSFTVVE